MWWEHKTGVLKRLSGRKVGLELASEDLKV